MIGMLIASWIAAAQVAAIPQPIVPTPIAMWIMDPCHIVGNMDEEPAHYSKADNARLARVAKLRAKKFATQAQCERAAKKLTLERMVKPFGRDQRWAFLRTRGGNGQDQ